MSLRIVFILIVVFCLPGQIIAQPSEAENIVWQEEVQDIVTDLPSEVILKSGDTISVFVKNVPEVTGIYTINEVGIVDMPYVGKIIAETHTLENFAQTLRRLYKGSYLVNPTFEVTIFASRLPDKEIITFTEPKIKPQLIR